MLARRVLRGWELSPQVCALLGPTKEFAYHPTTTITFFKPFAMICSNGRMSFLTYKCCLSLDADDRSLLLLRSRRRQDKGNVPPYHPRPGLGCPPPHGRKSSRDRGLILAGELQPCFFRMLCCGISFARSRDTLLLPLHVFCTHLLC